MVSKPAAKLRLVFDKPATPSKEDIAQAALQAHLDDARKERDGYKNKLDEALKELGDCRSKLHQCEISQASGVGVKNQLPFFHFILILFTLVLLWSSFVLLQTGVSINNHTVIAAAPMDWKIGIAITTVVTIGILALVGRGSLKLPDLGNWFK